jgi:hypothetical protein
MPTSTTVKQLRTKLGHIGYHCGFIKNYASIITPLEQLLKKYEASRWTQDCDKSFDLLKEKFSVAPILTYLNRHIEFHMHIDVSAIALGAILAQPREGNINHPIYFASKNIS